MMRRFPYVKFNGSCSLSRENGSYLIFTAIYDNICLIRLLTYQKGGALFQSINLVRNVITIKIDSLLCFLVQWKHMSSKLYYTRFWSFGKTFHWLQEGGFRSLKLKFFMLMESLQVESLYTMELKNGNGCLPKIEIEYYYTSVCYSARFLYTKQLKHYFPPNFTKSGLFTALRQFIHTEFWFLNTELQCMNTDRIILVLPPSRSITVVLVSSSDTVQRYDNQCRTNLNSNPGNLHVKTLPRFLKKLPNF